MHMPLTNRDFRSPTGQLVAGQQAPAPPPEQIGAYTIHAAPNAFYTTWIVTTADPAGGPDETMCPPPTQARARHVAAALACLDVISLFMRQPQTLDTTPPFFDSLRACLRFADVGPG